MLKRKNHFSWSQLAAYRVSPAYYRAIYITGEKTKPTNDAMDLGKIFASRLEFGEMTGDLITDAVAHSVPMLEISEKEVSVPFKVGRIKTNLFAAMDTCAKDLSKFKEFKTGMGCWSQKQVDECGQISFYAAVLWLKTGQIPQDIELVHIKTKRFAGGKLGFTGDIYRYPTKRSMLSVLKIMAEIKKAIIHIDKMWKEIEVVEG